MFLSVQLQQSHYILKVSVLLGLSFLCPLARDRKPLPGFFFLFAPIDISGLPSSPTSSLGYMMKKENPGNSSLCCFLCPKIPNQSPFFLPFLQSSYICFTYNFHSFYFLDLARSLTLANKIAKMIYASSKMKLTEQSSNYTTEFFFFFFWYHEKAISTQGLQPLSFMLL